MMHRPSIPELLKSGQSYYSLVIAVAKRAREIPEVADVNKEILLEKPVKLAVEDFAKGKYKLIESEDIGVIHEEDLHLADASDLDDLD